MAIDVTSWISVTSVLTSAVLVLLTIWTRAAYRKATMFKRLGMPGPPALPFLLNNYTFLKEGFISPFLIWTKQYSKIYGCFLLGVPSVVVGDLDLIREILVKKFGSFPNRVRNPSLRYKPWSENLLNLKDDHWKHVRSQLSPTFSAGKLKKMIVAIERVTKSLASYVRNKAESGEEVELKDMCQSYAVDALAGVAFGLQVDSLKDPNDPFIKNGKDLTTFSGFFASLIVLFPSLTGYLRLVGIQFPPKSANQFFLNVLESSLKDRRQDQTKRHGDFLQLLVEAEREGEAQGPVDAEIDHTEQLATSTHWTRKGLTQDEIYGNTLIFLFAGNETVSTTMSFTLFCLANNPQCLAKAQAEVDAKLGKRQVDYDTAMQLTYLDMCMNEAIRLYTPGFILDRESTEETDIGGYSIPKGMRIIIPAMSIHRDPAIWPDPLTYDPESPEARADRHPFAFMPFGMGPRNCIGMRLAQLEIRMALATILQHVTPLPCDKTVYPPKLDKMRMVAQDGLWVKFKARA